LRKGYKAGERRESPEADIQGMVILAFGVVPYMDSSSVCKHSVLWR
jgi:hypothetical protein